MKKWVTILLLFAGLTPCACQETCEFEVIDTMYLKKGYYVLFTDEHNRTIGVFTTSKKDAFSFNLSKTDEYTPYFPSSVLEHKIVVSGIYDYQDISKLGFTGVQAKIVKDCEKLRVYRLDLDRGFVVWRLSEGAYSEIRTIEQMDWPFSKQCLTVISPVSPNIRIAAYRKNELEKSVPYVEH